jgi:glycosyltransferase involved in cell wall biosynthesis/ubiquinone/menaquinone biosynthesis C-methylase UbiE
MREARTLSGLGYEVTVVGVVTATDPEPRLDLDGVTAVRLAPGAAIRRLVRRRSGKVARTAPRADTPSAVAGTAAAIDPPRAVRRERRVLAWLKRNALTVAYYAEGVRFVRQRSPALIHANDYNTMWIAAAAKLLCGSTIVYDSHELWADRNGRPEWRPWLVACEALFVRLADATITTSPGYAAALASRYRVPVPAVIRNIPDRRETPPPDAAPVTGRAPIAVYVGGLMPGRGLEQAIGALALADGVRLRLVGPGSAPYKDGLMREAERVGVRDRVELVTAVAPTAVVGTIADADVGLMLIQPVCRSYELTLPNKLFEYAAAGLPMVASKLPVIEDVVEAEGLGDVVPPADLTAIAGAIVHLVDPAVNAEVRARVRRFAEQTTWERERPALEQVYTDLLGLPREPETARLERVYGNYAASSRAQARWSASNAGNEAIRHELVQAAFGLARQALCEADAILDAGCGTGWWLARLAADDRITARLHGVELLAERVAAARERVPSASIVTGDVLSLPFPEGSFDVVSLFTVLSSLASPDDVDRALRAARRVLAPDGVLLIWEPRVPNPFNRNTVLVSRSVLAGPLAGMEVRATSTTVLPPLARRLGRQTASLYPVLGRIPALRTHRLISARRRR